MLKLVKVMPSIVAQLDIGNILQMVQCYIEAPGKDDEAKGAIKQLISQINTCKPEDLLTALDSLEAPDKSTLSRWITSGQPKEESKEDPASEFKISEFQQRLA